LVEVLERSKLCGYASRQGRPIQVEPHSDSERAAIDGGPVIVTVLSRTPKKTSYKFKVVEIPLADHNKRYAIANSIVSDHQYLNMMYKIRYKYRYDRENSRGFNFDAHDIAW